MKQKTYKQIEESRNRRLWITSVLVPVGTIAANVAIKYGHDISREAKKLYWKAEDKIKDLRNEKKEKKEIKKVTKKNLMNEIKIYTLISDIECLCDTDEVMAKCNKLRELIKEGA